MGLTPDELRQIKDALVDLIAELEYLLDGEPNFVQDRAGAYIDEGRKAIDRIDRELNKE